MLNFQVTSNRAHSALMQRLTAALRESSPVVDKTLLSSLLKLKFENAEAEKDFFKVVAEAYQVQKLLHNLNDSLARCCCEGKEVNRANITEMLNHQRVAALFLAQELILDNVSCAAHLQEEGVFYPALSVSLASGISSVISFWKSAVTAFVMHEDILLTTFTPLMPLIAPYLLEDACASATLDATTFKTDREEDEAKPQISMLNSIDGFITKYLMAGLDEARKFQDENLMSNAQYRGRCKVLVALDIRNAIIAGKINVAEMQDVLRNSLDKNGFSNNHSAFMDGSSHKFITGPLSELLNGCLEQPNASKSW